MGKRVLTFGDIEIEKDKFHRCKSHIFLEDVDIENVLVSSKISAVEKCYKLNRCILCLKMVTY